MEFASLGTRALAIRALFETHEQRSYGRTWSLEELALGLVGDVGDLAKLVQAREGVRDIPSAGVKLEHELADILWSVIVIADPCEIDLEAAFVRTMDELEASLAPR